MQSLIPDQYFSCANVTVYAVLVPVTSVWLAAIAAKHGLYLLLVYRTINRSPALATIFQSQILEHDCTPVTVPTVITFATAEVPTLIVFTPVRRFLCYYLGSQFLRECYRTGLKSGTHQGYSPRGSFASPIATEPPFEYSYSITLAPVPQCNRLNYRSGPFQKNAVALASVLIPKAPVPEW